MGRIITSAECGAGRHRTIECSAECPFNPFAVSCYDQLMDIEDRLDRRTLEAFRDEIGVERLRKVMAQSNAIKEEERTNAPMLIELFFRRKQGQSFAERWLAGGKTGLSGDEQIFFAGKSRMRVGLWEVQEIGADGLVRVQDLLEPEMEPVWLLDRSFWSRTTRYQVILVWSYPLPHFWRMTGGGIVWPDWYGLELSETDALREIVQHLGGPKSEAKTGELQEWLALNFERVSRSIWAVSHARKIVMLDRMDAEFGWSEYRLNARESQAVAAKLEQLPEVIQHDSILEDAPADCQQSWDWCESSDPTEAVSGLKVIGQVFRGDKVWRVQATGRMRMEALRRRFLELVGDPKRVPQREMRNEFGQQERAKIPDPDLSLVPPRLQEQVAEVELSSYVVEPDRASGEAGGEVPSGASHPVFTMGSQWLEEKIPALGGLTPREASVSPTARPLLIRLMKQRIQDEDFDRLRGTPVRQGAEEMVRTLGLDELISPPPPPRPCPPDLAFESMRTSEDEDEDEPEYDQAPEWPGHPLSEREVFNRMKVLEGAKFMADDLVNEFVVVGGDFLDVLSEECGEPSDLVVEHLEFVLALAWAILGGFHGPASIQVNRAKVRLCREDADVRLQKKSLEPTMSSDWGVSDSQPYINKVMMAILWKRLDSSECSQDDQAQALSVGIVWLHVLTELVAPLLRPKK